MPGKRTRSLALTLTSLLAAAIAIGGLIGRLLPTVQVASLQASLLPVGWRPVDWPLMKDQFESGIAVECMGAGCTNFIQVTVRAKIGFCNCVTGIADDEELERIGDISALGEGYMPVAVGRTVMVAGLNGRVRHYTMVGRTSVLSIAYSHRCDAIAVTARGADVRSGEAQVWALLESKGMREWVGARLSR